MSAESTKEATAEGHKVTTVVEGTDATAAPPAEPKVAIVTGASRGLGRGVAAILAKEAGFTVYATGRTTADLAKLEAECADGAGKVSPRRPVVVSGPVTPSRRRVPTMSHTGRALHAGPERRRGREGIRGQCQGRGGQN